MMTVVKSSSKAWPLRKADEDLQDVFLRNWLRIVLGTRLTDRISYSRLYERERPRWLGQVLWMKDERLLRIVGFGQLSRATRKVFGPRLAWEDIIEKNLREMWTSYSEKIGMEEKRMLALDGWVLQWVLSSSSTS